MFLSCDWSGDDEEEIEEEVESENDVATEEEVASPVRTEPISPCTPFTAQDTESLVQTLHTALTKIEQVTPLLGVLVIALHVCGGGNCLLGVINKRYSRQLTK